MAPGYVGNGVFEFPHFVDVAQQQLRAAPKWWRLNAKVPTAQAGGRGLQLPPPRDAAAGTTAGRVAPSGGQPDRSADDAMGPRWRLRPAPDPIFYGPVFWLFKNRTGYNPMAPARADGSSAQRPSGAAPGGRCAHTKLASVAHRAGYSPAGRDSRMVAARAGRRGPRATHDKMSIGRTMQGPMRGRTPVQL